jgi:hypothetical protein
MTTEIMQQCADMIAADAIQDLAAKLEKPESDIRALVVESPAYEALYDFETGMWQEGPDYFASLVMGSRNI